MFALFAATIALGDVRSGTVRAIDNLNKHYGVPGWIAFCSGHCGFPEVTLSNHFGVAEIALYGANVLSYRPVGRQPVLFRPAKRVYKPGEQIHGGIPVCWPQFGNKMSAKLPAHGFARVMCFEVRGTRHSEDATEITLGLTPSGITRKFFPYNFDLEIGFSLSTNLSLRMTTKNTDTEAFEFTAGFHPYFLVQDRDLATLKGVDGLSYINAATMEALVQKSDLTITTDVDHVFDLPSEPKHEFELLDPCLRRKISIAGSGYATLVVWNPGTKYSLSDCAVDDWRKFICIEPVTHWPRALKLLEPGETHNLLVTISHSSNQ